MRYPCNTRHTNWLKCIFPNFCHPLYSFSTNELTIGSLNSNQAFRRHGLAATRLRVPVPHKEHRIKRGEGVGGGPLGRLFKLRRNITYLFDEERLEMNWCEACETRLYAERLIQETILASSQQNLVDLFEMWIEESEVEPEKEASKTLLNGSFILELSLFWLSEVRLVEKLFKVYLPRYQMYDRPYTSLFRIQSPVYPSPYATVSTGFGVLEMHGNAWPLVRGHGIAHRTMESEPFKDKYLINVLVNAARTMANNKPNNSEPNVEHSSEFELKPVY